MGQFDVTQKQWQDVMGNNPSGNRAAHSIAFFAIESGRQTACSIRCLSEFSDHRRNFVMSLSSPRTLPVAGYTTASDLHFVPLP
jgi:hypothetical protein